MFAVEKRTESFFESKIESFVYIVDNEIKDV